MSLLVGCKSTKTSNFVSNNKYRVIIVHAIIINGDGDQANQPAAVVVPQKEQQLQSSVIMCRAEIPYELITSCEEDSLIQAHKDVHDPLPSLFTTGTDQPDIIIPCPSS